MTQEELDDAEESGNAPCEMVGCGAIVVLLLVIAAIVVCAVVGVPWKGVVP